MKRTVVLSILVFCSLIGMGQNISVTFTGAGAANRIDSVTATNLTTNQTVTLPGNETLLLTVNTGSPSGAELSNQGMVFPNPFSGSSTLFFAVEKPQTVYLKVQNLVGQVVLQTKVFVQSGENEFALSINAAGIFIVSLTTEQGTASYKIICTDATQSESRIQNPGSGSGHHKSTSPQALKSFPTVYNLGYTSGDVILYKCRSGIYTTILTDSPTTPKNYEVEFAACTDPEGKNYSIVKIGAQTWMAENLAYLPGISPSSKGSDSEPFYYVYGYEGNTINEAKSATHYTTYGVLYNWEAAKNACPSGWLLPTDSEWTIFSDFLGNPAVRKMKETGTSHWTGPNNATNESGFTALPGGLRFFYGGFANMSITANFWSSMEKDATHAYNRMIQYNTDFFYRSSTFKGEGRSVRCLRGSHPPTASFTVSPPGGIISTPFQFDASASSDDVTPSNELEVRWDWDGDENWDTVYDTLKIISHQYTSAGTYSVILEVKDGDGLVDTDTLTVKVTGGLFTDDRDGHVYVCKTIGTQIWMIENLAFMPAVSPSSVGSDTLPYYYVYGYQGDTVSTAKATDNFSTYGALYNWPAAFTACPSGWHLPGDEEWKILEKNLGMSQSDADSIGWRNLGAVGGKLKEAGTPHWINPNTGATNSSGFTALPGGRREGGGGFGYLGRSTLFWSASESGSHTWTRGMYYTEGGVGRQSNLRDRGFSVRCLKN